MATCTGPTSSYELFLVWGTKCKTEKKGQNEQNPLKIGVWWSIKEGGPFWIAIWGGLFEGGLKRGA